jgi:hypothetical protein
MATSAVMIILNIGVFPKSCGAADHTLEIVQEENLHRHQIRTGCTVGGCYVAGGTVLEARRATEGSVDFILAVGTLCIAAVGAQSQVVKGGFDFSTIVALESGGSKTCWTSCVARLTFIDGGVSPESVWAFEQAFVVVVKVRLS